MIFDTGSDWLWVYSRICGNCYQEKFNEKESDSFKFWNVIYDLHYGSGDVYGYISHDQVCINEDNCADDFGFMTVGQQVNLNTLMSDGLVGMSPKETDQYGDLFILKMKETGVIDHAIFSMYINLQEDSSVMSLGGYDLETYALPGASISWHDCDPESYHWQLNLDSMSLTHRNHDDNLSDTFQIG